MPNKRSRALIALTITAALWGVAVPVIKYTQLFIPPFTLLFFRLLLASLIIFPFFVADMKERTFERKDAVKLVLLSLFGQTIHLSLVFLGLSRTGALEGSLIAAVVPVFTIIAGAIILKERIVRLEIGGLLIILMGAAITLSDSLLSLKTGSTGNLIGNILLLLGGLSWTAFAILSKELFEKYKPLPVTALTFFVGLATFLPLMLWEIWTIPGALNRLDLLQGAPGILYLGIFSSIFAYGLYEFGLKEVQASEADIFSYLVPLFALPASMLILKEKPTLAFIIGGLIIAVGVVIYNHATSEPRKHIRRGKV